MWKISYFWLFYQVLQLCGASRYLELHKCGSVKTQMNVELSCFTIRNSKRVSLPDCEGSQLNGTILAYKCKNFYTPFKTIKNSLERNTDELVCDESGNWIGINRYNEFRCKEDCGRLSQNAKPLIINGIESNRTLWPWHVTLYQMRGTTWTFICGGTLIRNQVVVTAAHCIIRSRSDEPNPRGFRVVLGARTASYLENALDSDTRIHKILRVYVSENYDPSKGYQADIAVLHLEGNVEFSENIIPICLPNDYSVEASAVKPGVLGKVAGFGLQENGKVATTLQTVELEVQSGSECFNSLQRLLPESQFCAGAVSDGKWRTLCNGDSGGGIGFPSVVHQRYHIHGITSSGDSSNARCQNYAVFTRIYSFIFWIRDVIEEISGEIARDLHAYLPYPYILRGTESFPAIFRNLPREWENRVAIFSLTFVDVDPNLMFESLEFAQTLVSFNLSAVELIGGTFTGKRILLPHLATFQMDLLQSHWKLKADRTFPEEITISYLKKFIFFDKTFASSSNWKPEDLLKLGPNIQLTLGIFKVLHVDSKEGLISLNSVPFTEKILNGLIDSRSDFILRSLAIARCEISNLRKLPGGSLLSLTVYEVTFDQSDFNDAIKRMPVLTKLRISLHGKQSVNLNLDDLSVNLQILTLSGNVNLEIRSESSVVFLALRSFMCDFCEIPEEFLENVNNILPNLTVLVMRSKKPWTLGLIKGVPGKLFYLEKHNLHWRQRNLTDEQVSKILFTGRTGGFFWTSELEFRVRHRLKSYEKIALNTGVFSLRGDGYSEEFKGIPFQVQQKTKVIRLSSVKISPVTLRDSIIKAPLLKEIQMENVYFQNKAIKVRFQLETIAFENGNFSLILEENEHGGNTLIIPFQNFTSFDNSFANIFTKFVLDFDSVLVKDGKCSLMLKDPVLGRTKQNVKAILGALSKIDRLSYTTGKVINNFYRNFSEAVEFFPDIFLQRGIIQIDEVILDGMISNPFFRSFKNNYFFSVQLARFWRAIMPFIINLGAKRVEQAESLPPLQLLSLHARFKFNN